MNTQTRKQPCVLVVDDQKNWLDALCEMLDSNAYDVETATSYDEAMRKLRWRAFHVLVTDQRLVDADKENIQGILLLDELDKLQDGTQAIIVTGYPTIEAAKKALKGRKAHDYLLKHPEGGSPFNIRAYRELIREAADIAIGERERITVKDAQKPDLIPGLTYDQIAETLFYREAVTPGVLEDVKKVLNWLFYPLQPLARGMGKVWLSKSDQMCEVLCWSRNEGRAALVKIGKEQSPLETSQVKWIGEGNREKWYQLQRKERYASAPVAGVSYSLDKMTFEDFTALVEEE